MQRIPSPRDAESAYSKATRAEITQDYDSAFQNYVKAADLFLYFSKTNTTDEKKKEKWRNDANKALQRAEKIKQFIVRSNESRVASSSASSGTELENQKQNHLTPVPVDPFSPQQQSSWLRKGSTVNGLSLPLWDENASTTTCNPPLSAAQEEMSAVWRVPSSEEYSLSMSPNVLPQDISQNVIADCSVCASISVCLEHARRFGTNPFEKLLHARSNSVYDLKFLYNGAWRKISIDNQLPYHPELAVPLCLTCSPEDKSRKPAFWPSLVEKAYMKLMGGYDFLGSNSSIDLHTLIGWIPEHLNIKSSTFERERTWTRLIDGFTRVGGCMVTVGTGKDQQSSQIPFKLLASHSYAVIDIRADGNERIVTILDPWVRPSDTSAISERPSRIMKLTWSQVLNVFEGIYISWDPKIWPESLIHHGSWRPQDTTISSVRVAMQSSTDEDDEILVLLSRHIEDTRKTSEFIALKVQLEDEEVEILAANHDSDHAISTKGSYTNSPHILARLPISRSYLSEQSSAILSISVLYDGQLTTEVGYTISVYAKSHLKLTWGKRPETTMFVETIPGSFNNRTAGGNPTYPSFMFNPQYHLRLSPERASVRTKGRVMLTVEGSKDLPMQIMVVWSQGQRIIEPSEKDIVTTSGPYSYGVARLSTQLLPGDYNVIVSAFEPGYTGDFKVTVASSLRFNLANVPQESAGMFTKIRRDAWSGASAAGAPSFDRYFENPVFEFSLSAAAKVQVRLQLDQSYMSSSLNVAIYSASQKTSPDNPDNYLATSRGYSDALTGVITPLVHLPKGKYWIVPSTYNPGMKAPFKLIVYSTVVVEPERVKT
ncbi:hypothetical protein E1B28_010271 [Marasmius oreades]|uniref:Calpain catalytic domain-containing protein n=1 Tax=Marasmius oreades TaxID=181124 RepID=A0A9P7URL3_9AGAR|nr:uncharacterized protein E1B28_010271 [Marasmius oreades]KAG7091220.1 hypothetical protein E1B28_010271 [Marasmius oreades]